MPGARAESSDRATPAARAPRTPSRATRVLKRPRPGGAPNPARPDRPGGASTGGRRIARLSPRGWTLLVCGALVIPASYGLGRSELLSLGSFLVLLPLSALAFVRLRRMRLSVERSFSPAVVSAGHPTTVRMTVRNLSSSSTTEANWRENLPWSPYATVPAPLPVLLPRGPRFAARGSASRIHYQLTPPARGVFAIGPMLIDFSDPFGLADGALVAGSSEVLTVTPDVAVLADDVVAISADEGPTRMLQRRALGGEDDLTTREYRRGDALRRVHWRASAHAGQLMVRQEEQRSHAEARLLLDTLRRNYRDVAASGETDGPQSAAFEWAVRLTASLGLHLVREGFLVRVIETGVAQLASLERGEEFLESLASIALTDESAGELSLLRGVQRPDRSQGSVFVILSDADARTVESLASQRRSFDLAVAFLVAPRRLGLARSLTESGWLCVTVNTDDPIDDAWRAVGAMQTGAVSIGVAHRVASGGDGESDAAGAGPGRG
jgi:uncharacterized protein (DUF58 family)